MERMEVEQCAGAGGGVPLRRSNSAPMITSLSDSSVVFQPFGSRCRRSSVSLNLGCPGLPFTLSPLRTPCHHSQEAIRQQAGLTGTYPRGVGQSREAPPTLQPSSSWPSPYNLEHRGPHSRGENPSSSSLCAPNFDRTIARLGLQPFAQTPLKRKGCVEMDSPPNKLFVAGVHLPGPNSQESVRMLVDRNSPADLSPESESPGKDAVFLPASPATGFLLPNSHQ
ncbi:P2R1A-PPP2R2A-interacting phosphatase regulator 1-like isoform X2 [Lissotriton helveticus]